MSKKFNGEEKISTKEFSSNNYQNNYKLYLNI